ncbi:MAG: SAM-dependent methyltransferase [Actinomycetota bacterium]
MVDIKTDEATKKAVVEYYDGSWFDYRVIWLDRGNLAKHFGYWEDGIRTHSQSLLNMNKHVAARVDPKPGERVLDAGCGIGGSSMWLAKTFGVTTVGISLSARELDRARRYSTARGLQGQCSFEQQDFIATDFPDQSFDIVWAQESSCHTTQKDAFAQETFRLLKPGGRMVIEDWFRPRRPYLPEDEKLFADWLRGWAIEDLPTRQEIVGSCEKAGFVDVKLDDITPQMLRSARHLYYTTIALYPGAHMLRWAKVRTEVLHANLVSARLQWRAYKRDLWFAGILVAHKPSGDLVPETD